MKKIFKKIVIPLTVLMFVFIPLTVMAHAVHGDEHSLSTEDVLAEILQSQNIKVIQDIDCQKITGEQFESLGDAVMEQMHPGEAHEAMDKMMGGEGSESLRAMHIQMGRNYLGCNTSATGSNGIAAGMMNMMGSGMLAPNSVYSDSGMGSSMMNSFGGRFPFIGTSLGFGLDWIFMILFLVFVILGIAALVKYLFGGNGEK